MRTLNEDSSLRSKSIKSSWGERHIVVIICFLMAALNYSLRFNLSIGIVAMVKEITPESRLSSPTPHQNEMCPNLGEALIMSNETFPLFEDEVLPIPQQESDTKSTPKFNWDERDQGLILGSFFWGYVISQFPSGLLAQKYGGKWLIAFAMLSTGLLSIILPQAAFLGGRDYVIIVRILQGFSEGFVVPALVNLLSKWIPPEERAHLSTMSFAGFSFGTAMTMLVSGHIITEYGWPFVFYLPGAMTILLFIVWVAKVHASPDDHPSISEGELSYIKTALGKASRKKSDAETEVGGDDEVESEVKLSEVPWAKIACSMPVWAIFISQFCNAWSHNMLKSEGPKYLHSALHFNIHENSYVAASPYFSQMIFSLLVGKVSDFLLERKLISMLTARRWCNSIGQWGIAIAFAGIIVSGCHRLPAVICYILSGMMNGAMLGGVYVNIIDISPKYAGVIEGVINSIANIAGFGAPYLAGMILYHEPSILGWCYVFLVPVILNVIGNLVFILGSSVKVQPWDNIDRSKSTQTGKT